MSRARITTICMFAATLAVSAACSAQAPRVIAQKLYDQMDQAYANRDLNRMLGFYDSSYAGTDTQGRRLTLVDYRTQLEQTFSAIRLANPSTTIEDVRMEGGRIVVYYKFEMVYQLNDRQYGWVPVVNKRTGEDTWERMGGQWKIVRASVLREDTRYHQAFYDAQMNSARSASRTAQCASSSKSGCD